LKLLGAATLLATLPAVPVFAQDAGHVRVPFEDGAAWPETGRRGAEAPLPAGPAHANYAFTRNAESGGPQDRLRLKPANFQ
jgi:hypothetical protein